MLVSLFLSVCPSSSSYSSFSFCSVFFSLSLICTMQQSKGKRTQIRYYTLWIAPRCEKGKILDILSLTIQIVTFHISDFLLRELSTYFAPYISVAVAVVTFCCHHADAVAGVDDVKSFCSFSLYLSLSVPNGSLAYFVSLVSFYF